MSGVVIAIDGPDGVGKTTQLKLLTEHLQQLNRPVHATRASGGTPIGEELRKASLSDHPRHAETDVYISLAMHTELGYDLQTRKANNEIILVDRSPLAIVAYNGYGSQLPDLNESFVACHKMLKHWQIDYLFVLEASQSILDDRLASRYKSDGGASSNYFEKLGHNYFERVHQGYRAAVDYVAKQTDLKTKVMTIDASASVEAIQSQITKLCKPLFI